MRMVSVVFEIDYDLEQDDCEEPKWQPKTGTRRCEKLEIIPWMA